MYLVPGTVSPALGLTGDEQSAGRAEAADRLHLWAILVQPAAAAPDVEAAAAPPTATPPTATPPNAAPPAATPPTAAPPAAPPAAAAAATTPAAAALPPVPHDTSSTTVQDAPAHAERDVSGVSGVAAGVDQAVTARAPGVEGSGDCGARASAAEDHQRAPALPGQAPALSAPPLLAPDACGSNAGPASFAAAASCSPTPCPGSDAATAAASGAMVSSRPQASPRASPLQQQSSQCLVRPDPIRNSQHSVVPAPAAPAPAAPASPAAAVKVGLGASAFVCVPPSAAAYPCPDCPHNGSRRSAGAGKRRGQCERCRQERRRGSGAPQRRRPQVDLRVEVELSKLCSRLGCMSAGLPDALLDQIHAPGSATETLAALRLLAGEVRHKAELTVAIYNLKMELHSS